VSGYKPFVVTEVSKAKDAVIVVGSVQSMLVQKFIGKESNLYKNLTGKWECFGLAVLNKPFPGITKALLVAGSDARGTAYGVFSLSEKIGVSPWWWWADVPVRRREILSINQPQYISVPPSVTYRGIFINDEDWGLRPWASQTFEPEKKNIGPKTYAKVFELLLRLKANLLWPAMHPGTVPFYADPDNQKMADAYSIVVGSSHAEPMLRNNVGEWDEKKQGHFNYLTNRDSVYQYWEERVKQSSRHEVIYTMGMRGVHDSGIEGVKSAKEAVPLLERIMADQRGLLEKHTGRSASSVPQVFTAYKEVLDIYDNGLKLPEDVTLVWPDDNYGYIQRLNNDEEKARPGGSGVYYHASYWGRPHDYLWLSTAHPSLIRQEMMKAYKAGAHKLWVLNVGDIKPLEYNMQAFFDMAYNAAPFNESSSTKKHLQQWTKEVFGPANTTKIADILWEYYGLAFERKPEYMGWSQTEPTTKTNYTAYNHFYYGDEAQRRINKYEALEKEVRQLRRVMKTSEGDAFYQLVYYPVVCASWMNKKFLYRDKAFVYAKQNRLSAYEYAALSKASYDSIVIETEFFNNSLGGGKWKGIMSMEPRDLPVYAEPQLPAIQRRSGKAWSVLPEGYDTTMVQATKLQLPSFTRDLPQRFFVDFFLCDSTAVEWRARSSADWLVFSQQQGKLSPAKGQSQTRLWVTVNWAKAPAGKNLDASIVFSAGTEQAVVDVHVVSSPVEIRSNEKLFVETNGYISIYAQHFSANIKKPGTEWKLTEGLGTVGASLTSVLLTLPQARGTDTALIKTNAAYAAYTFVSSSNKPPVVTLYTLPTHPFNKNFSVRYGVSIDDGPVKIVDVKTVGRSEEWKQNVLRNSTVKAIP
ncbi:MAG TPA: glycosyl hydrolase 115 family protein, partial [Flavisolibacter sp.]|nr:glycosyl hydrolase 115 family protein [Flavisolibacter sp.]